jgi:hypothetical protein
MLLKHGIADRTLLLLPELLRWLQSLPLLLLLLPPPGAGHSSHTDMLLRTFFLM